VQFYKSYASYQSVVGSIALSYTVAKLFDIENIEHYGNILPVSPLTQFSTNISIYLRNETRYGSSYIRMRIWNRTQAFKWYHFSMSN